MKSSTKVLNAVRVDFDADALEQANKQRLQDAQDALEQWRCEFARRGVSTSTVLATGDPREQLCEVARREQPDVMLLGHRATPLRHLAQVGSVVLHAIEHAPCPVYIVRV